MSAGQKIWKLSWRLALCLLLLGWLFHTIFLKEGQSVARQQGLSWDQLSASEQFRLAWNHGPAELWRNLSLVHPGAFGLSVVLMGMMLVVGVIRWRLALRVQGLDLPWGRTGEISLVAHFFNSFFLGSTGGDVMKAYYAARETHHKKTEAVVTVFVDRLIGLWALLLFAAVMMVPNLSLLSEHGRLRTLAWFILAMMLGCTGVVAIAFWGGVSKGWSGARTWLRRLPKGEWLERLLESCRQFGRARFFVARALGLSMFLNFLCVLQILVLCRGLGLKIDPVWLLVIVPVIGCISALPITPSGLGVRENLYVLVLAAPAIQIAATSALSLSLLAYAGSLFWSLMGGLVYLTLRERHHLQAAELELKSDG